MSGNRLPEQCMGEGRDPAKNNNYQYSSRQHYPYRPTPTAYTHRIRAIVTTQRTVYSIDTHTTEMMAPQLNSSQSKRPSKATPYTYMTRLHTYIYPYSDITKMARGAQNQCSTGRLIHSISREAGCKTIFITAKFPRGTS